MFVRILRNIKRQELEHEISVIDQQIKGLEDLKKINQDKLNNLDKNLISREKIVLKILGTINKTK